MSTASLIAEGASIKERIKADSKRLKEIEAELVKLPPGKHPGNDGTECQVIAPSSTIKLNKEDVDQVKEVTGDEAFSKLFDRVVTFKPVKGFREILGALLGKRDQNKVLKLTEEESTSYVKWS